MKLLTVQLSPSWYLLCIRSEYSLQHFVHHLPLGEGYEVYVKIKKKGKIVYVALPPCPDNVI
jgi:hypothetical protein